MKKLFKKKRSRGRPKGKKSLKKAKKVKVYKGKKRGRPAKVGAKSYTSYKNMHSETLPAEYVAPKSYKFLGYCPGKCDAMINKSDLVSKRVYVCWKCGKRKGISKLKQKTSFSKDAPTTKREFLQTTNVIVREDDYLEKRVDHENNDTNNT